MMDDDELMPVPKATDWTVHIGGGRVFLESETVGNADHYDDALLNVTGNMSMEAKEALAHYATRKLNDRWHSPREIENLKIERDTLAHGKRLADARILELESRLDESRQRETALQINLDRQGEKYDVLGHYIKQVCALLLDRDAQVAALLGHCPDGECPTCAEIICPHKCDMHFHHDGCPACAEHEAEHFMNNQGELP